MSRTTRCLTMTALASMLASCDTPRAVSPRAVPLAGAPELSLASTGATTALVELGDLGAGPVTEALDVSDSGVVVGFSHTAAGNRHGFVLRDGVMTDLTPTAAFSDAEAIDALGDIAGAVGVASISARHATLWRGGTATDLGTLGGMWSMALAINNAVQVVGESETGPGDIHAFLYEGGRMQDLGTLGGRLSGANAINDSGDVVGVATDASGLRHAVLWHSGAMIELGMLPGDAESTALGINNSGIIVGASIAPDGATRAVKWQNRLISALPQLASGNFEFAIAVNDRGQMVGGSISTGGASGAAVLWQNDSVIDLGRPSGAARAKANGINRVGLVAGDANLTSPASVIEGVVWVLPTAAAIRGGGPIHPAMPPGHGSPPPNPGPIISPSRGPSSAPPGNGRPSQMSVCSRSQIPIGYWMVAIAINVGCPTPLNNGLLPNSFTVYDMSRLKVGQIAFVCGRLEGNGSGTIVYPPLNAVSGMDNRDFVLHTPGQLWQVVRNPNPWPPAGFPPPPPGTGEDTKCNVFLANLTSFTAGGPTEIVRVR